MYGLMPMSATKNFTQAALEVIKKEADAISGLAVYINETFDAACNTILLCKGRVVVMGLGKSGHIGGKIAATLASTGTPAFFLHAAEAIHGDFGMVTTEDVVIAISNSGKTSEILTLMPHIKALNIPLVAITSDSNSPLAQQASVVLNIGVKEEACNLTLAPTSSSTASLVMGDALAIALLHARGFTADDFARSHPGGTIGKRLLLRVGELMHSGNAIPRVTENASLKAALVEMTAKRLGITTIVDNDNHLLGVFTDGDLRRALEKFSSALEQPIAELMTRQCRTIHSNVLAFEALEQMEQDNKKITVMPVIDDQRKVLGVIHVHDILAAGVI
jgi:arabinose-5-phosphate isomerase